MLPWLFEIAGILCVYVAPSFIAFYNKLRWRWAVAVINFGLGVGGAALALSAGLLELSGGMFLGGWIFAFVLVWIDLLVNGLRAGRRS
jgi:hypothetical protein